MECSNIGIEPQSKNKRGQKIHVTVGRQLQRRFELSGSELENHKTYTAAQSCSKIEKGLYATGGDLGNVYRNLEVKSNKSCLLTRERGVVGMFEIK